MTEEKERVIVSPKIYGYADGVQSHYFLEVELPGVNKENISLKMQEDSFYIKGETEGTTYVGSYGLCCLVKPDEAKATYNDGLLKVEVPFKDPMENVIEIPIQ